MLMGIKFILIALINFLSALLQGATGFGYSLVAMSLMPYVLHMRECSAISAVVILIMAIQMSYKLRKHIDYKGAIVPVLCCLLTMNLGIYILLKNDEKILRLILATLLILITLFYMYTQKKNIQIKNSFVNKCIVGLVTGINAGMFNIVGPIFLVFYSSIYEDTLKIKATLEFSFLIIGSYSVITHLSIGNINVKIMPFLFFASVAILIAGEIGIRLYNKINKERLSRIIYIMLPILAISLLI